MFAEFGFKDATIRKISKRAQVNIASIKYHFGGKEELYTRVFQHCHECGLMDYSSPIGVSENEPLEKQLHGFVRALLLPVFDRGKFAWFGRLMVRELIDPTKTFENLLKKNVLRLNELLHSIVRKIIGDRASEEEVQLISASIIGQCLFYVNARYLMTPIYKLDISDPDAIERLADHITQFSMRSLRTTG